MIEFGKSKFEVHDVTGAMKLFASVDKGSNRYINAQCFLARCHRQSGNDDDAIRIFDSVLQIDSLCDDANVSLAEIYAIKGNSTKSQFYASKVSSLLSYNIPVTVGTNSDNYPNHHKTALPFNLSISELFQKLSNIEPDDNRDFEDIEPDSLLSSYKTKGDSRRPRRPRVSTLNTSLLKNSLTSPSNYIFDSLIPYGANSSSLFVRSITYKRYDEEGCKQVRLLYKRSLILLASGSIDEFFMASGLLIADFINNGHFYREGHGELRTFSARSLKKVRKDLLSSVYQDPEIFTIIHALTRDICPDESNRGLRQTLLQASHGLTVQEWFDVIFRVFFFLSLIFYFSLLK